MCRWVSVCFVAGRHKGSKYGEFPQHLRISRDHCLLWETKPFEMIAYENVRLHACFFFLYKAVILGVMFIIVWNSLLRKQDGSKLIISAFWKLTLLQGIALKMTFKECSQLLSPRPPFSVVLQLLLKVSQCIYKLLSSGEMTKIWLKTAAIDCWTGSIISCLSLKFPYSSLYSRTTMQSGFEG